MSRFKDAYNKFEPFGFVYLAADETARAKFPEHKGLLDALEKDPNAGSAEDRRGLFTAFAQALDPSGPPPHTSPWKYLGWIVTRYKTDKHNDKPILAEDFDRIYQQLDYLSRYQGKKQLNKDITKQTSFADLANRVQPFIDKQTEKSLARQAADDGVTILHHGENGAQLLICHTPAAAKLYGLGTKWCITMGDKYFHNYNFKTPIIMLMGPITADAQDGKTQEKWALVDKKWWDATDTSHTALPPHIQEILDAMLAGNQNYATFITQWQWQPQTTKEQETKQQETKTVDWSNHDDVLDAVTQNGLTLRHAREKFKANRKIVMAAVMQNSWALEYTAEELKADREIVMTAVTKDSGTLVFAAQELKADTEIVLAAVTQDGFALQYAALELKADRTFILAAVTQNGWALKYAAKELKTDRAIVMAAVTQNGVVLGYAAEELRADHKIVMTAVKQNGRALEYAAEELKTDREIVMAAVTQNGRALEYAAEELKTDREIVMTAVTQNGWALEYAAEELKTDRAIVMAAVTQNGGVLGYATEELKTDRAFLEEIAPILIKQNNPYALEYLNKLYYQLPEKDEKISISIQRRIAGNMIKEDNKYLYADNTRPDNMLTTLWGNPDLVAPVSALGAMNDILYGDNQKITRSAPKNPQLA